jgi:4-hydroxyphenylpyruvate dioxygenase
MTKWANFYEKIFNFREIRYFHITGQKTGLLSRAMTSPCGKIRIPINEPTEDSSQIAEYLREYKGEGIQHIALTTKDIVESVNTIKQHGIKFLDISETYYEIVRERFPTLDLKYETLAKHRILIDGEVDGDRKEILFQIFTETVIGPIFFELIQREGHQGFGEGNFSALFESMTLPLPFVCNRSSSTNFTFCSFKTSICSLSALISAFLASSASSSSYFR